MSEVLYLFFDNKTPEQVIRGEEFLISAFLDVLVTMKTVLLENNVKMTQQLRGRLFFTTQVNEGQVGL